MTITIKDVARASGVHISTVSRAFSAPDMVRPETRDRVLAAAASLGYRPNPAARALITGRTHNIGLVVPDIANPFFPAMIKAAESQARQHGYHVFVADTHEDVAAEEEMVRALAQQVDGIVLCSSRMPLATLERLRGDVAMVTVNRPVRGIPAVVMDVGQGAREAAEHLIALGHRRLHLLAGPYRSWTDQQVRLAVAAVAKSNGAVLTVRGPNRPTEEAGIRAVDDIRRSGATGVLAYNDIMAIGLIGALEAQGTSVPAGISVIGIDDVMVGRYCKPRLTTVAMPTSEAGRMAVDILMAARRDGESPVVSLPTVLIVRESSGPVAG